MLFKQVAIAGLGASVIGGSATGIYFLTKDNSIRAELIKSNKKLLDSAAPQGLWEIKLHTYNSERKSKHELNLTSWSDLKSWCTSTLSQSFSKGDKNYESGLTICTVPINREKLLKEKKNPAESRDWAGKETKYKTEGNGVNAIPNLADNKATADEIRDWCNGALNNEYQETGGNYALTLKWCTKEGQ
ncbi:hypothetical protein A6V39_00430 [Candidatus Mycoplasma haematobovis]|uniref:Uncharacterized protein n=1 Tax=Candidatus Mycoplasma haematobovis TaxID=432608 RepID=A0A1A9QEY9_9MOLU|nr:hypothetical protein [Candidatus Mycoplasma haematobovis]OAL10516.1 hypothetical protein A6V39_00430 [Candidatus Mycoplasma haematobovis]